MEMTPSPQPHQTCESPTSTRHFTLPGFRGARVDTLKDDMEEDCSCGCRVSFAPKARSCKLLLVVRSVDFLTAPKFDKTRPSASESRMLSSIFRMTSKLGRLDGDGCQHRRVSFANGSGQLGTMVGRRCSCVIRSSSWEENAMLNSSKGTSRCHSSQRMMPKLYTSALSVYSFSLMTSGASHLGLKTVRPVDDCTLMTLRPKSATLATTFDSALTDAIRTLGLLRSRWMMLGMAVWRKFMPLAMSCAILRASAVDIWFSFF
mmetsp:Transcript_39992/g.100749  ORF Transcript_39992/g.100749 Transcript_39992/m.100749 type:complete len:261 (-) Transcript_39992:369-1151(-)